MWIYSLTKLYLLLLPGSALWVVSRLMASTSREERVGSGEYVVIRWASKLMITFGMLGVLVSLLNPIGILLIPFLLLTLLSILFYSIRISRENFVSSLVYAVLDRVPVAWTAHSIAKQSSWFTRGRFLRFARHLNAGQSLSAAAKEASLNVPIVLRMQLAQTAMSSRDIEELDRVLEQEDAYRSAAREWLDSLMYFFVVGTVLCFGAAMLFRNLAQLDRGLNQQALPNPVAWMGKDILTQYSQSLMVTLVLVGIVGIMSLMVAALYYLELLPRWSLLFYWGHRRFDLATTYMALGRALQNGSSWEGALSLIAEQHPFGRYRRAAKACLSRLRQGQRWDQALIPLGRPGKNPIGSNAESQEDREIGRRLIQQSRDLISRCTTSWLWLSRLVIPLGMILIGGGLAVVAIMVIGFMNSLMLV